MKLFLFAATLFLSFACSKEDSNKASSSARPSSLPFPLISNGELSKKELQKLETNQFKSKFVKIKPGEFLMGSPSSEIGRGKDEQQHKVQITNLYYISKFELTIKEWNTLATTKKYHSFEIKNSDKELIIPLYQNLLLQPSLKGKLVSSLHGDFRQLMNPEESTYFINLRSMIDLVNNWNQLPQNIKAKIARSLTLSVKEYSTILHKLLDQQNQLPVNQVSYTQAVSYCHKLTEYGYKNNLIPGRMIYRLPTEAEWEYACRAGLQGACGIGEGNELSGLNANLDGSTKDYIIGDESTLINRGKLIPVGNKFSRFPTNRWGLSDMHGSVMEWCYDFYDQYPEELVINPIGPLHGKNRVLRGGSFYRTAYESRSANRESSAPSWRGSEIGFRVVLGYPLR